MDNLTKTNILKKLTENKEKIRSFGVDKIFLFGSYAKNKQKSKSDIDFLIEFKDKRGNYKDHVKLLHFLEDLFNKKIDLIKKNMVREELKESILGGKLYEAKV